jgi:hypothetical protein
MKRLFVFAVFIALLLVSCKKDKETSELCKVVFSLNHKVGSQPLEFNKLKYTNASGHKYEIRSLKYFISNITFSKLDGSREVFRKPVYLDARDSSTLTLNDIEIPFGDYNSISFTFGINETQNIPGSLNTVREVSMAWPDGSHGGGYHYMKLEGTYDSLGIESTNKNYNIHTGPTMGNHNSFDVLFDNSAFTISEKGLSIQVTMNINEWFTNPENYDFSEYGHMIMMNLSAQNKLRNNGTSVFSVLVID